MAKLTIAEFEAHISDRITQIAFEKATGKLTDKQAESECLDLARWAFDRMRDMPLNQSMAALQKRITEALDK
ncbi:MAG TPA: hypothetical protein VGJ20_20545 [Xanthobacteraceae bacterium]|jgi:hypothetical protein